MVCNAAEMEEDPLTEQRVSRSRIDEHDEADAEAEAEALLAQPVFTYVRLL